MNGRAIQGAYLFRLYVCDKEMSWSHHIGETHQPDWFVYVRESEKFRLTNVIPERIIFVSRGITVSCRRNEFASLCKMVFNNARNKRKVQRGARVCKTLVLNLMKIRKAVLELYECRSTDGENFATIRTRHKKNTEQKIFWMTGNRTVWYEHVQMTNSPKRCSSVCQEGWRGACWRWIVEGNLWWSDKRIGKTAEWTEKNGDWESEDINDVYKPLAV